VSLPELRVVTNAATSDVRTTRIARRPFLTRPLPVYDQIADGNEAFVVNETARMKRRGGVLHRQGRQHPRMPRGPGMITNQPEQVEHQQAADGPHGPVGRERHDLHAAGRGDE
jgi:hypothetical protein